MLYDMSYLPMVECFSHLRKICQTKRGILVFMVFLLAFFVLELQIFLLIHREGSLLSEGSISRHVRTKLLFVSSGSHSDKRQSPALKDSDRNLIMLEMAGEPKSFPSPERFKGIGKLTLATHNTGYIVTSLGYRKSNVARGNSVSKTHVMLPVVSYPIQHMKEKFIYSKCTAMNVTPMDYSSNNQVKEIALKGSYVSPVQSSSPASINYSNITTDLTIIQERNNSINITSISEMKDLLIRNRAFVRAMRPRWTSAPDQEMLNAKRQIHHAPILKNNQELYAPAFWNLSMFKRSYDLMERTLKVYVYKEGLKPVFHKPTLDGIYASEGWFMKLIEESPNFVVNDPRKAHLFYNPFSSSILRFSLYVPGPHGKRHLLRYLNNYIRVISTKYPFWNRTGGADHFSAACHDWAPYLTRHSMRHSIRVLCNSDISEGFKLGKDVSLPQANVLTAQNPLGELGGRDPKRRRFLSFFAGRMHGYLRPVLLKHWENKDPDMKIIGKLTCRVKCRVTYAQYMRNSKYCICPRGYQVYSPRVVEAIRYECVPVIISDNYVPPFFYVLNWEAFSVLIAEKDIPHLKDILLSIPEKKYISLQVGVRRVQRHFLWHSKPVKYDMFHMILHSVWLNRLNQMGVR